MASLIVKISHGTEIRRFTWNNEPPRTWPALSKRVGELFELPKHFKLTYVDDEGDRITLSSDDELSDGELELDQYMEGGAYELKGGFLGLTNNTWSDILSIGGDIALAYMRREPVTTSRLPFAGRGGGRCRQEAETALRCASFRMHLGDYENHALAD